MNGRPITSEAPVFTVSGHERDRFAPGLMIRWWLFLHVEDGFGRAQAPRLGVDGRGFTFARGGRVETEEEAEVALKEAAEEARRELEFWRGQPSHALVHGRLVPLDEVLPELPS